jgi:carbonic anhydrase/acetyltransferase-like protein (isoleucine patch superfamily)
MSARFDCTGRFPWATIVPFEGKVPQIHESAFVAPGCRIIGDVTVGAKSSIWYNCVLRADNHRIVIGQRSNVQDGSVLHVDAPADYPPDGCPLIIGDDVLIGHMALVHGCTIEDRGFVGMNAVAMNKARIGSEAMLATGAMLTERKEIPPREIWAGSPAKYLRSIDETQVRKITFQTERYCHLAERHMAQLNAKAEA